MQKFAIYDLDRTILIRPTFTLFLFWAAATERPWRLLLVPLWLLLAAGYALHLYDRNGFKPAAIRLMLGKNLSAERMKILAQRFADWRIPADVAPGAKAAIARDRAEDYRLIMATAAPEFYACALGRALGFDAIIASRHARRDDGSWQPQMIGENCYGPEKARRVAEWMAAHAADGAPSHIRAYSDHPSDAALFTMANEAVLVGRGAKLAALAARNGWILQDFSKSS